VSHPSNSLQNTDYTGKTAAYVMVLKATTPASYFRGIWLESQSYPILWDLMVFLNLLRRILRLYFKTNHNHFLYLNTKYTHVCSQLVYNAKLIMPLTDPHLEPLCKFPIFVENINQV
jgi:hypothetical protein